MKKNVASQIIGAQMVSATDGSAFAGAVSCTVTKDGGAQTAGGGTVTYEGNGFHSYTVQQSESNADHVAFTFTGTGAVPATVQVYPSFPQTGDSFGLIGATGSGLTSLATQASVNTIDDFLDTEVAAILAAVDTEVGAIKTKTDFLPSVTAGAAGGLFIAGSNAATSITTALTANITGNLSGSVGSVTGAVGSVTGAVGSVTGNVGGNVVGSVASVSGAVGSVTGLTAADVGAIKLQTDKLTFNVGNEVSANVESINNTAVIGVGTSGDKWRA